MHSKPKQFGLTIKRFRQNIKGNHTYGLSNSTSTMESWISNSFENLTFFANFIRPTTDEFTSIHWVALYDKVLECGLRWSWCWGVPRVWGRINLPCKCEDWRLKWPRKKWSLPTKIRKGERDRRQETPFSNPSQQTDDVDRPMSLWHRTSSPTCRWTRTT